VPGLTVTAALRRSASRVSRWTRGRWPASSVTTVLEERATERRSPQAESQLVDSATGQQIGPELRPGSPSLPVQNLLRRSSTQSSRGARRVRCAGLADQQPQRVRPISGSRCD
jgi:hypothetical protein